MKKTILLILLFIFCGHEIYSHRISKNEDSHYYGIWKTDDKASVQITVEIHSGRHTVLRINNQEIYKKRYYFARTITGKGYPIFQWDEDNESKVYTLYFIAGGESGKEYGVGFYNFFTINQEGEVLHEEWKEVKLFKINGEPYGE